MRKVKSGAVGSCRLSESEGGKDGREVKCALRRRLAIHAVSERPESQSAKAQGP